MTQTGSIMGTAQYLSPEQAQGYAVSEPSDLYSIGIILYELLTGRVPFEGESAVTIALKHVNERPMPPSSFNPAVSPELEGVVLRALEKDPARRFPDADAFIAALEHARAVPRHGGVRRRRPSPRRPTYAGRAAAAVRRALREEPAGTALVAVAASALLLVAAIGRRRLCLLSTRHRPAQVAVPDVVGTDQAAASTALQARGLRHRPSGRARANGPRARSSSTDPAGGDQADKGSTVTRHRVERARRPRRCRRSAG